MKEKKITQQEHEKIIYQTDKLILNDLVKKVRMRLIISILVILFLFLLSLFLNFPEFKFFSVFLLFFVAPIFVIMYFVIKSLIISSNCKITNVNISFYQRVWGFPVAFTLPLSDINSFFTKDYRLAKGSSFHFKMNLRKEYFTQGSRRLHARTLSYDYSIGGFPYAEAEKVKQFLLKKNISYMTPKNTDLETTMRETYGIPNHVRITQKVLISIFLFSFLLLMILNRFVDIPILLIRLGIFLWIPIIFIYKGFITIYYKVFLLVPKRSIVPRESTLIEGKRAILWGIFFILIGLVILFSLLKFNFII